MRLYRRTRKSPTTTVKDFTEGGLIRDTAQEYWGSHSPSVVAGVTPGTVRQKFGSTFGPEFPAVMGLWDGIANRPTVLDGTDTADEVRTALGSTLIGDAVFTAEDPASVRDLIGARDIHNILDPEFGVELGTTASQTVAIKAALDAHPGEAFFFPPGTYRLDTQLNVTQANSLHFADGARLYAGAAMGRLIHWYNGATHADNYAQHKCILGPGVLDGNLLADKVLEVNGVLRMPLGGGLTLVNGIHRGLVTGQYGAELHVNDLRIYNTGTTNVADNIGIEAGMNDCRFQTITMRDITHAVWDKRSNYWDDVHPWLGTTTQLIARYENSVAFLFENANSVALRCLADTYRRDFATAGTFTTVRLLACEVYCNSGNLTLALAQAYPHYVLDLDSSTSRVMVSHCKFQGHSTEAFNFLAPGSITANLTCDHNEAPLIGYADFKDGVQQGVTTFTPSVYGSTVAGTQTVLGASGTMEIRNGIVEYTIAINATLGADITGNLRIGGLPMPPGAAWVAERHGPIHQAKNVATAHGLLGAFANAGPMTVSPTTQGGAEVPTTPSTEVFIRGSVTARYGK